MKRILLSLMILLTGTFLHSQTISIVSPEGLTPPYEVSPGTEVTFKFDHFEEAPTSILTYIEEPDFSGFGIDPVWTESSNYSDNGDGTFNFTVTIDEELWVWTGYYQSFLGMWAFSNVIHFQIASGVEIIYEDGVVCGDGTDIETLSVVGEYDSYQWFLNNESISGATSNTYDATEPGAYKVQVPLEGVLTYSNTLNLSQAQILLTGSYNAGDLIVEMEGSPGFDAYQWMSGSSVENLTPLNGENESTYWATLSEETVYYAVVGTLGDCSVATEARPISSGSFATPVIILNADTNAYGKVCEGTSIELAVDDIYGTYKWFRNGFEEYNETASLSFSQAYQQGSYSVNVAPIGWPEISISSQSVNANYFTVSQPELVTDVSGPYCSGQEVNIILGDEGYEYTWYVHTNYQYTEDDLIDNPEVVLNLIFEEQIYVTVVAANQGCTSSRMLSLNSAASNTPSISFVNWDDQYLCTDSLAVIEVSPWSVDNFENFQWYKQTDGNTEIITGANSSQIAVSETGVYLVKADLVACENTVVESGTIEVYDYLDRELYIYADMEEICLGDETNLNISDGNSWQNIQWFKEVIQMGQSGYEKILQPMVSGIGQPTVSVEEFTGYVAKAKHNSCPNGIKISSNRVAIRPAVNPTITVDPNYGVNSWHLALYDSIPGYLYCAGEPVTVSVPDEYDAYSWYLKPYSGDGNYGLEEPIEGATGTSTSVIAAGADWVTARVELDGCVGVSTPVLIDTWVFSTPAITSYGNAELCQVGDSTLLHVAFPGNYESFEWYVNGMLIPNSNNDSIWAKQPGMYTLTVYREECPEFGLSSGVGPYVSILEAYILENDTVIYAMPEYGYYTYQWYFNGEPLDPSSPSWVLYKDDMADGIYTVEVSNNTGCTSMSSPYFWETTGLKRIYENTLNIHPNPTIENLTIDGIELSAIKEISILSIEGRLVNSFGNIQSNRISLANLKSGIYIIEIRLKDNTAISRKVVKEN